MKTKTNAAQPIIVKGAIYHFIKSGNLVRAIEKVKPSRAADSQWVVERVNGDSAGKRMIVQERSLVEYGY